jgi:hypothetical protein
VKGLSRETRLLLDRGRGETLEPEHRARLKRSVFAGAFGASAAATTLTAGWMATAAKVTAALIFVGGATTLVAVGTGTRGAPSHPPSAQTVVTATPVEAREHAPAPSTTVDSVRVDPPVAEPARPGSHGLSNEAPQAATPAAASSPTSRASATAGASAHAPSEPSLASSLHEEALLVREANAALESGDAARSLALAEEHARRFPNGALLPEGSAVHILALCQAGQLDQARTETGAFLLAHPEGPLSMRVRSSCGGVKP